MHSKNANSTFQLPSTRMQLGNRLAKTIRLKTSESINFKFNSEVSISVRSVPRINEYFTLSSAGLDIDNEMWPAVCFSFPRAPA